MQKIQHLFSWAFARRTYDCAQHKRHANSLITYATGAQRAPRLINPFSIAAWHNPERAAIQRGARAFPGTQAASITMFYSGKVK